MRSYSSESLPSHFTYMNTFEFTNISRSTSNIVQRAEKPQLMSETVANSTTKGCEWLQMKNKLFSLFRWPSLDALNTTVQRRRLVVNIGSRHCYGLALGCDPSCLTSQMARGRREGPGVTAFTCSEAPSLTPPVESDASVGSNLTPRPQMRRVDVSPSPSVGGDVGSRAGGGVGWGRHVLVTVIAKAILVHSKNSTEVGKVRSDVLAQDRGTLKNNLIYLPTQLALPGLFILLCRSVFPSVIVCFLHEKLTLSFHVST